MNTLLPAPTHHTQQLLAGQQEMDRHMNYLQINRLTPAHCFKPQLPTTHDKTVEDASLGADTALDSSMHGAYTAARMPLQLLLS